MVFILTLRLYWGYFRQSLFTLFGEKEKVARVCTGDFKELVYELAGDLAAVCCLKSHHKISKAIFLL